MNSTSIDLAGEEGSPVAVSDTRTDGAKKAGERILEERDNSGGEANQNGEERPFLCDICDARFNRRSTLWNHRRIHSECRPFVCPTCNHRFKWKNSLKCHRAMHVRRGEQEEEAETGRERRRGKRKASSTTANGKRRTSGEAEKEERMEGDAPDFSADYASLTSGQQYQYRSDDQSVTQLPSLTSTIFEPLEETIGQEQAAMVKPETVDWYYYGDGRSTSVCESSDAEAGRRSEEDEVSNGAGAYYAKVLPCHMW